ncbi:hypothetical protein E2C01_010493 [Portunus trituberculatus]|uniref:Uncharacterized protein n=1 Tax=Portunus trituberculatus TaxID=210409 RepID=A0A5B7D8L5_PORTR|nr:hypothetical protein [Portunus trituberculatus]
MEPRLVVWRSEMAAVAATTATVEVNKEDLYMGETSVGGGGGGGSAARTITSPYLHPTKREQRGRVKLYPPRNTRFKTPM